MKRVHVSSIIALVMFQVAVFAPGANAVPIFYFTSHADGSSSGNQIVVTPGTSGTMYLAVDSDIHFGGISLDVLSSDTNTVKFTGASVKNDDGRWALIDGPFTVAANGSSMSSIGGGAIPGVSGIGIGPGTSIPNPTVLAALNYTTASNAFLSNLSLRVGFNEIVDWDGNYPTLRFGADPTTVTGHASGTSRVAGVAIPSPEPTTALLFAVGMSSFTLVRRRPPSHDRV
jgi:hypothetical protein